MTNLTIEDYEFTKEDYFWLEDLVLRFKCSPLIPVLNVYLCSCCLEKTIIKELGDLIEWGEIDKSKFDTSDTLCDAKDCQREPTIYITFKKFTPLEELNIRNEL